jgi:hypothetical protein
MGPFLRSPEQGMTGTPEEIALRALYKEMQRIRARVPSRWFLFGSITTTRRPVKDIDLLVVCKTIGGCATARAELASICGRFPIHLLLMTSSEEAGVKFIQGQSAVEITQGEPTRVTKAASP